MTARPLLPCPPDQRPPSVPEQAKPKRSRTKVACIPCCQAKSKCDGARPACLACSSRSLPCSYEIPEGDSRHKSLKRKHAALQRDFGGALELLWHLQQGPDTDAQTIFDRLRRGDDPSTILASLTLLNLGGQPVGPSASASTAPPSVKPTASTSEPPSTFTHPGSQRADAFPTSSLSIATSPTSDSAALAVALRSRSSTLKHAFSVFLQCTAFLFHVYTQEEVNNLLDSSLREEETVSLSTLCEACGIAAIGSRYSRSQISPEHGNYYFSTARQLLDECIERTPLRAVKVCAILAMCNIVNKATVALAYIELGLSIARTLGLLGRESRPDVDPAVWIDSKKVCRSLTLARGWLQTTLSYVHSTEDSMLLEDVELEQDVGLDNNAFYQIHIAKLTILEARIFRSMQNTKFSIQSSRAARLSLGQWSDSIPAQLRLENLSRSPALRMSGLYLHAFYLGSQMLMYRWTLSWALHTMNADANLPEELEPEAARWVDEGILAAAESAATLHTMYSEGAAVKHCWFCIFQAYLSCCILLYDVTQKRLCGRQDQTWEGQLDLACKSMEVLSWAGQLDPTANQYHTTLKHIFEEVRLYIAQPSDTSPYQGRRHDHFVNLCGESTLHNAASKLSPMLHVPLGSGHSIGKARAIYRPPLEQTATNLDEVGLGVHLTWALEFTASGNTCDSKCGDSADSVVATASLQVAVEQSGHFAGGHQPPGWTLSRSFTDPSLTQGSTNDIFKSDE